MDLIVTMANVFEFGYLGWPTVPSLLASGSYNTVLGDVLVDWLAKGGQTIDMRTLSVSHVRFLIITDSTKLTLNADHNDGTTVHQGIF